MPLAPYDIKTLLAVRNEASSSTCGEMGEKEQARGRLSGEGHIASRHDLTEALAAVKYDEERYR